MAGKITLSIELELGWGTHMLSSYDRFSIRRKKESIYLQKLLDICDQYDIPITFNVVGKLLSDNNVNTYETSLYPEGWWDEYKTADKKLKKLFYAPDLIQNILDTNVDHEFATHTLSHIMIDEVSRECFEYEIRQIKEIHKRWGIEQPTSFVAPRHRQFDPSVLTAHDLQIVRIPDPSQPSPNLFTSSWMLLRDHPVRKPKIKNGVIRTYSTSYPSLTYSGVLPKGQLDPDPQFQLLPLKLRQQIQLRYLKNAVKQAKEQNSHAHLWTHLWDMANEAQWQPIETFIKWLSKQVGSHEIRIQRMKDIVESNTESIR